jgi:hypothetical protein
MQSIPAAVGDAKALMDTKTHAVQALTCISSISENLSLVVESGSVQAIMGLLSSETENSDLSTSSMMFLESLCGHGGALDELIQSADIDTIIQSLCTHPSNEKLHLAALKVFLDLATSEETLKVSVPLIHTPQTHNIPTYSLLVHIIPTVWSLFNNL